NPGRYQSGNLARDKPAVNKTDRNLEEGEATWDIVRQRDDERNRTAGTLLVFFPGVWGAASYLTCKTKNPGNCDRGECHFAESANFMIPFQQPGLSLSAAVASRGDGTTFEEPFYEERRLKAPFGVSLEELPEEVRVPLELQGASRPNETICDEANEASRVLTKSHELLVNNSNSGARAGAAPEACIIRNEQF
ncbi:unnamed protein product, partial [Amoebophrya sp. A120]